jgi:hypothetical protein
VPALLIWATEFTPGLPVPTRLEDLVIYELHVGSLGFGKLGAGDFDSCSLRATSVTLLRCTPSICERNS